MLRKNLFWLCTLIFLAVGTVVLLLTNGPDATLWANAHHHHLLDRLFVSVSYLAEWAVVVLAVMLAFYKNWQTGLAASLIYGLEAMSVQLIKLQINAERPRMEIGIQNLHEVKNVTIHSLLSFPSGHTAAAFMGFGILSTLTTNKALQVLCAIGAMAIGYSRMYLGQHYLRDVLAGAAISTLLLFLFVWILPSFERLGQRNQ